MEGLGVGLFLGVGCDGVVVLFEPDAGDGFLVYGDGAG